MDKFDRIQQLHRLLKHHRRPVPMKVLSEELECSEKTVRRALENLRDYVKAPVVYCEERNGWHYCSDSSSANYLDKFELPGLWLTAEEIHAFAHFLQILHSLDVAELSDEFSLIEQSIGKLLQSRNLNKVEFASKVRYLPKRKVTKLGPVFKSISLALMNDRQIGLEYCDFNGRVTQRQVSPLKLVYYDENWYLDAFCHLRSELRSFMLARINSTEPSIEAAQVVPIEEQDQHFASAYGIFAGKAKHRAKLKFQDSAAREAAAHQWHAEQVGQWQGDAYQLEIPYNDDRELIRTLLGYGPDVEVLAPAILKKRLLNRAKQIVTSYDPSWGGGKF